uniref:Uncharacterized protein n=1 Tax=Anguilla anguilla TaxID=7936 RepID=A0A0E9VJE9_ANGAN
MSCECVAQFGSVYQLCMTLFNISVWSS